MSDKSNKGTEGFIAGAAKGIAGALWGLTMSPVVYLIYLTDPQSWTPEEREAYYAAQAAKEAKKKENE